MPITKNIRRKRSIFCQKKKHASVIDAAVLSKDGVWILCKGRVYCDGKFRYWINGREGIVNKRSWITFNHPGWNEEIKALEICKLNCRFLELNHPLPPKLYQNDYDNQGMDRFVGNLVRRYRTRNLFQTNENYDTLPPEPPYQIVEADLPTQV